VSVYLGEDGRPERLPEEWRERAAPYERGESTDAAEGA
jgi:hypothetical protein